MDVCVEQIAPAIWAITLPLAPGSLACYVVRSSSLLLIDTGYLYTLPALDRGLASLGLRRSDVDVILLTHGHADHLGACTEVRSSSNTAVLIHPADMDLLRGGVAAQLESRVELVSVMAALSAHEELDQRRAFLRASIGAPVTDAQSLHDGCVVDLGGGVRLTAIHTPGHTPGSVVVVAEADGIAFAGDAVQGWGGRPGVLPLFFDVAEYEKSLQTIESLDLHVLALAHPYRWSGDHGYPSPIRRDGEVGRTLQDSRAYVQDARLAVSDALTGPNQSASEFAGTAINRLPESYLAHGSRWECASAAALLALADQDTKSNLGRIGPRAQGQT